MQENPGYANQTFEVQTKNYCRWVIVYEGSF
jgi:hypothetical protein